MHFDNLYVVVMVGNLSYYVLGPKGASQFDDLGGFSLFVNGEGWGERHFLDDGLDSA
jgi:hypothetical protein